MNLTDIDIQQLMLWILIAVLIIANLAFTLYCLVKLDKTFTAQKYHFLELDINLLRNYNTFNYEMIRLAFYNGSDHHLREIQNIVSIDKRGNERKKNPFRKMKDDDKLAIIRRMRSEWLTNYILYRCNDKPSDYLQKEVNKLKLKITFND
ncbi:hypothetical protein PBI_SCTP2_432 [Salicola phage SCTP-2]|nr:hypothetical protein PBI_SCTP2_432 [Salicola phage SCTP-2]